LIIYIYTRTHVYAHLCENAAQANSRRQQIRHEQKCTYMYTQTNTHTHVSVHIQAEMLLKQILDDNNEEMNDIIVQFSKILDAATRSKVIQKINIK